MAKHEFRIVMDAPNSMNRIDVAVFLVDNLLNASGCYMPEDKRSRVELVKVYRTRIPGNSKKQMEVEDDCKT